MLDLVLYINLGICSSWLVWFGLMFYYTSILDTTFKFVPLSRYERYKYWLYISVLLLFSYYIFIIRLSRIGKSINAFEVYVKLYEIAYSFDHFEKTVLGVFILLVLIYWYMLMRMIYQYLRKCFLGLYLYYFQYAILEDILIKIANIPYYYTVFLWHRVKIFYDTSRAYAIANVIWPNSLDIIERNIFRFIIPYLFYFDCEVHDYCITKIFMVLPYYYIYTVIRSLLILFDRVCTAENMDISREAYGIRKKWFRK